MANVVSTKHKISPYGFTMEGDLQLLHTLMKQNSLYNIPNHMRDAIIQDAGNTFQDGNSSIAHRNAAAKVLLECDKRNIDMLKMVVPKQVVHRTVDEMTTEELVEQLDEYANMRQTDTILVEEPKALPVPPNKRRY